MRNVERKTPYCGGISNIGALAKSVAILAVIILLTACNTSTEPLEIVGENSAIAVVAMAEFTEERIGDVRFLRPPHWAAFVAQLEPPRMEFWDAEYYDDQPFFIVQQLPIVGVVPTLEDLLAEKLDEVEIEVIVAEIAPIIYPVDAVHIFGTNGGMEVYEIRFVYNGWLYAVSASHSIDNDEHRYYVLSMIQNMIVD